MMFFEDTGEFWMLHGTIMVANRDYHLLKDHPMLAHWSRTLRARETRLVEVGLFGKDLRWFSQWEGDRPISRRNSTQEVRQSRDWSSDAQLTFLTDAYNRARNLFALERSTETQVTQILMQFDRERFTNTGE